MANVETIAETNLIVADDMKRVREVDFTRRFTHEGLDKFNEVIGVTRKIAMMEGTTMYVYTVEGKLENGIVGEGEIIPLSHYEEKKTPVGNISLRKWRKASSAESIAKSGLNSAVRDTDAKMLRDAQREIRTDFFTFLNGNLTGAATAGGADFQSALADAWGQLQILFEDDAAEPVYFVNPRDVSDYLGAASITTQTAFGLNYIEDFLGLGTVIISSQVAQGTFIATAKENFVMYYLTTSGDLARTFDLTTDETGYIGISSGNPDKDRAQIVTLVMTGVTYLVEYAAGVVKGTIGKFVKLDKHIATIAINETVTLNAETMPASETVTWASSDSTVATVSSGVVTGVAAGAVTITATITVDGKTYTDTAEITVSAGA